MKSLERELNQDIYSNDNVNQRIAKKRQRSFSPIKKYSSTKVKARNFLSIASYNRIKNSDYENKSFVIDCFSFLLLYLNPFYLERKFESIIERDYINVLWSFMMPETLYNFICKDENFKILNKVKLKFNQANEIIKLFLEDESFSSQKQQFDTLKTYLIEHAKSYQFIYANLFPRCFARIDDYGVQSKTKFNVHYKNYLNQKNIFDWYQKNSSIYQEEKNNESISGDSTPLNMTKLNEKEEEIVEVITQKENIKKEDDVITTVAIPKIENNKQKKKKAAKEVVLKKLTEEEKKENKKNKLKMSAEKKKQKRNEKKRKLEEQLIENTEKIQKIKKNK